MIALIIIGLCIIPVVFNVFFTYICFKQKYKGRTSTIEDFVNYWDDECIPSPLVFVPAFSLVFMLVIILWIITYPIRVLILAWYNKIKYRKI